jgi:hypothetical protein
MTLWGFYPSIWLYWVLHLGVLVVYGIFVLTRKDEDYAEQTPYRSRKDD